MLLLILIYIVFGIITIAFVFILFFDLINYFRGYGPNLPSTDKALDAIIKIYDFDSQKQVADFGSGSGKIINRLKKYNITITGYEINPLLYFITKIRFLSSRNVKIFRKNFLDEDFNRYNVIIVYGGNYVMKKMQEKILENKIKNIVIISNIFQFTLIPYTKKVEKIYLYQL